MRKNLLTLTFSIACIFLFVGNSLAETKIRNMNLIEATKNSNVVKNIKLNKKMLNTKYKQLMENCSATMDKCSDAYTHLAWATNYAYEGCSAYGWTSDYCQELGYWLTETTVWTVIQCMSPNSAKIKSQKLITIDSRKQKVFRQFDFDNKSTS